MLGLSWSEVLFTNHYIMRIGLLKYLYAEKD